MKTIIYLLLLPFLVMPIACSKSEKSKPAVSKYFYHGNPLELLAGSTTNPNIGFDKDTYLQFDKYILTTVSMFSEKSERTADVQEDAEDGNEATDELDTSAANSMFSFSTIDSETISYDGVYGDTPINIKFKSNTSGKLELQTVSADSEPMAAKLLHFSITPNQRLFSLLVELSDPDGSYLLLLTFSKDADFDQVKKGDKKYYYTEGRGVLFAWDKTKELEVNYCIPKGKTISIKGKYATYNMPVKDSFVSDWQSALGSSLKLKYKELNSYPPFSDLNTHCIYVLDSYVTEENSSLINYGMALTIKDVTKSQIVDGDIFLNSAEFKKQIDVLDDPEYRSVEYSYIYKHFSDTIAYTISHEFGHLLGLDHVFDGTASIMSYEFGDAVLSSFDKESIQYLYK